MLPRPSQRSIFHLGEEGGDDHQGAGTDEHVKISIDATTARHHERRRDHGRQRLNKRDAADDDAAGVGLQILVQHRHHTQRAPAARSHIVLKQVVLPTTAAARHRSSFFLRTCSLCRRELSANKDVYMYRGDQGFCSEECRWHQMLKDDAREREAMVRKERVRRGFPHHLHHGPRPAAAIRGAPRRLVAVAY
ncbi:unnamed protein product [Urochloa decumbens]|uniref:FLZ-type domain-containing protein n=1 Tax=Urochloa decumbens TaxID=240449 RepID=A0ABC9G754_9POAL